MTHHYVLRPMRLEDIPQVVQIDQSSFPTPWSPRTYQFEVTSRETSHMVVLEIQEENAPEPKNWLTAFRSIWKAATPRLVVGYGGCWLIAGEAHISTIAVHPAYRRRKLGELLLIGMLQRAIHLNGEYSVLEVRESNLSAQTLYRKYGFEIVGRRKGYYRDNGEDALLMETRPLDKDYAQRLTASLEALREHINFVDQFTTV
jgi:ribosomal-protein-alanine N-acetyltransferase